MEQFDCPYDPALAVPPSGPRSVDELLSGRHILDYSSAAVGHRAENGDLTVAAPHARIAYGEGSTTAHFSGDGTVHELRVNLEPTLREANGIYATFMLDGWSELAYVAVGYTKDGSFRHVKLKHIVQGKWTSMVFSLPDLAFRVQNDWDALEPGPIADVRLYVKGTRRAGCAHVTTLGLGAFQSDGLVSGGGSLVSSTRNTVLADLKAYLKVKNPKIEQDANAFLEALDFPIVPGTVLDWPADSARPVGLQDVTTYRYIWHSLYPAVYLLLYWEESHDERAYFEAFQMVNSWLDQSFYSVDADLRYTWYDHGTAERLVSLLIFRSAAGASRVGERTRQRLDDAILQHAFLLESESFYAVNQNYRFHNHAWFQDIALLAAGALVDSSASHRWITTAQGRLTEQIAELICLDSGYSVFVENSIGYHHGIASLVELGSRLLSEVAHDESLLPVVAGLHAWSKRFKYPDNRSPSTGDTFRLPNADVKRFSSGYLPAEAVTILTRAGYAIIDGVSDELRYTLCFLGTSLSATHKHEDNLSFTLWADGVEWLIDPSFYSHEYSDPIPAYLRSADAHNMVLIKDVPHSFTTWNSKDRG